jgi:hypothetical protein
MDDQGSADRLGPLLHDPQPHMIGRHLVRIEAAPIIVNPQLEPFLLLILRWNGREGAAAQLDLYLTGAGVLGHIIPLIRFFNSYGYTGNPKQMLEQFPEFKMTTLEAYLKQVADTL